LPKFVTKNVKVKAFGYLSNITIYIIRFTKMFIVNLFNLVSLLFAVKLLFY